MKLSNLIANTALALTLFSSFATKAESCSYYLIPNEFGTKVLFDGDRDDEFSINVRMFAKSEDRLVKMSTHIKDILPFETYELDEEGHGCPNSSLTNRPDYFRLGNIVDLDVQIFEASLNFLNTVYSLPTIKNFDLNELNYTKISKNKSAALWDIGQGSRFKFKMKVIKNCE